MKSRVHPVAARRLGITLFLVLFCCSLVSLCWGMRDDARSLTRPATSTSSVPLWNEPAVVQTVDASGNITKAASRLEGFDTPGLVNLTNSAADERNPVWSPRGDRLAFLSNGALVNGAIGGPVGDGTVYTLYTMHYAGGYASNIVSHASVFPTGATIRAIAWDPVVARNTLYVVASVGNAYNLYMLAIGETPKLTLLHASPQAIGTVAVANADVPVFFFERMGTHGKWEICKLTFDLDTQDQMILDPLPTPEVWLSASGVNYRRPALMITRADNLLWLLYDGDESGASRIYLMNPVDVTATPQLLINNTDPTTHDTQPQAAMDRQTVIFTSTRPTSDDDTTPDKNLWIATISSVTVPATAKVRLYANPQMTSDEEDPSFQLDADKAMGMLFASTKTTNAKHDVFAGSAIDNEPPYIISAPIAKSSTGTKVGRPGDSMTVSVRVRDHDTGVGRVWMQIKDPDPKELDELGLEHVITRSTMDTRLSVNDMWVTPPPALPIYEKIDVETKEPVEYGVLDPIEALNGPGLAYPSTGMASNAPGYYAAAGLTDTGAGYPNASPYWIEMFDDGIDGDAVAGDGIYSCRWLSPSWGSDWIIDIIVEDDVRVRQTTDGVWAGNRQRYDNVGGCSTRAFLANHSILLVDDFADGHKFLSRTVKPLYTRHQEYCHLNTYYYFANGVQSGGVNQFISPFTLSGGFGGVDIWRIICRGAVSSAALDAYLPSLRGGRVSPTDGETPIDVVHAGRLVVWIAPAPDGRIRGGDPTADNLMASGSITEERVRKRISSFVQGGGHIWLIGSDLLSEFNTYGAEPRSFMSNNFGVGALTRSQVYYDCPYPPYMHVPFSWHGPQLGAVEGWYGMTLPNQRWLNPVDFNATLCQYSIFHKSHNEKQNHAHDGMGFNEGHHHNVLNVNENQSQYDQVNGGWVWETFTTANGGNAAFAVQENRYTVGVSKVLSSSARTVFWGFGYEHLSSAYRHRAAGDTIDWLLDGAIRGQVTSMATNAPIAGALVKLSQGGTRALARTNHDGTYVIYGLQPGWYTIDVSANGFYRNETTLQDVVGGKVSDTAATHFRLQLITGHAALRGKVTNTGLPFGSVKVQLRAAAGEQQYQATTDITGAYVFDAVVPGDYKVKLTAPGTPVRTMELATPITLQENETQILDIDFAGSQQQNGKLTGRVTNDQNPVEPVVGATVTVTQGQTVLATATTDVNGTYSIAIAEAGTYSVQATADGHVNSEMKTIDFDPATGMVQDFTLVVIIAERKASIYGRILYGDVDDTLLYNKPVGDAQISLVGPETSTYMSSATMMVYNGVQYNFSGLNLPAGSYTVTITKPGYRTVSQSLTLTAGEVKTDFLVRMTAVMSKQPGTWLFSLPGDYRAYEVPDVFSVTRTAMTDRLATYTYDATPSYRYYPDNATLRIVPGQGYWLRASEPVRVGMEGEPLPVGKSFERTLQAGWNLIGNPFSKSVSLTNVRIKSATGQTLTWAQAVQSGLAGTTVHGWNGRKYQTSIVLEPYQGYWMYVSDGAMLVIPYPMTSAPAAMPHVPRSLATTSDWRVELMVRAGECEDSGAIFGVAGSANDAYDPTFDSRKPPMPCGQFVGLAFMHPEWGTRAGEYLTDIRAPFSGEQRWNVRVTTNVPNADVVMSWPRLMSQLPHGYEAVLVDAATRQPVCYLNTARQYAFRAGAAGAQRDFEIVIGPRTAAQPPERVRTIARDGGAVITYTLSAPANITCTIRSMNGRLVRKLTTTQPAAAGENTLVWDGRSQTGALVAPGTYACELVATDAIGRTMRVATTVRILTGN